MHIRALRSATMALIALIGTVGLVLTASMTTLVQLAATALIMGGTGMKVLGAPHQWGSGTYLDQVNDTYLADRHLGEDDLEWVSTPEHFWPATGLSDLSFDTSVARGVLSLNNAILATPGEKVVVSYSQSANIATREKRNLAELRAQGAVVPSGDELSFVFVANPNRPNGGILARFEGLYVPILGISFDGATPDDEYPTIDVAREYDLIADFPKYPLNLLADLNALFGYFYLHPDYGSSVIDLDDPSTYQSHTSGNTTYYLVHTEHLPLLQPLRDIGFPEPILALVEPTLRVLIDLGYDRTPENMGVPTRAQLFPRIDLDKLASDLRAAAEEGVHNALFRLGIDTGDAESPNPQRPAPRAISTRHSVHPTGALPTGGGGLTQDGTDIDAGTTAPETTRPRIKAAPVSAAKIETAPMPERIRQSLRQALSPTATSDDPKVDAAGDARHPVRRVERPHADSAQPPSRATKAKQRDTQGNPRHNLRTGRPDAAQRHRPVKPVG
ncbi:PE-PPE domain-containing protein [Mycolicibacterium sp. HK-90]|uniref:PE-PPE domain-containing protein n=1 Tax=Mycolicibacterium sp. HK-90 TaxID=3056937 RepID=UPI00265A9B71|nr:PE-PPE domain-containing protein [Mycolicibacterium sp. HK-90]WKG05638.1 PE-PPE domain-containing protein [Mycolicibacterium sp. HK-90]